MRVDTKQLYFVFMLIALKINASPVTDNNELDPLGSSVDFEQDAPNIRFTTRGKKYLVLN